MSNLSEDYYFRVGGPGTAEDRIARELGREIESALFRLGILGRVFSRSKSGRSIAEKLGKKREVYITHGKKMQDLFGVRVAVYFSDDSEIAQQVVRARYQFESESIDLPSQSIFGPTRCNLVFRLPDELAQQSDLLRREQLIDSTFEVQFRTVLSEGWHEVEHDLRYKRSTEWANHPDLDRALNGIIATLETCDWSMLKIFDDLAWRHYKDGEYAALIQAKFRLRLQAPGTLAPAVINLLRSEPELVKALFRVERASLLSAMIVLDVDFPLSVPNIIFLCNRLFIGDFRLTALEPPPITQLLDRYQANMGQS
jgi:ppGpp synthetase/RelA/SpoT-type nucleotidyltranferase